MLSRKQLVAAVWQRLVMGGFSLQSCEGWNTWNARAAIKALVGYSMYNDVLGLNSNYTTKLF